MGYKKNDPCIKKAYDDERLFVLMARDPEAPRTIIHWISRSLGKQPTDKLREAMACALEMQERGAIFRDRRDKEKKDEAELKQREEFERWKKSKEAGEKHLADIGFASVGERGPEILIPYKDQEKKGREAFGIYEKNLINSFANWLDSMGVTNKINSAHLSTHGFGMLAEEFLNSLSSPPSR